MTAAEYDDLIEAFEKRPEDAEPSWVVCRLENALAMAAWCAENGMEKPEIAIKNRNGLYEKVEY